MPETSLVNFVMFTTLKRNKSHFFKIKQGPSACTNWYWPSPVPENEDLGVHSREPVLGIDALRFAGRS